MASLALLVLVAVVLSGSPVAAADDDGGSVVARGYLGNQYIGCLELGFSRCFAQPTLICLEDAMVECSLQGAAAAPAATGAAAPSAGGGAAAELVLGAVGGVIARSITNLGAKYIDCVEVDLATKCFFLDPTVRCVEEAMGEC